MEPVFIHQRAFVWKSDDDACALPPVSVTLARPFPPQHTRCMRSEGSEQRTSLSGGRGQKGLWARDRKGRVTPDSTARRGTLRNLVHTG